MKIRNFIPPGRTVELQAEVPVNPEGTVSIGARMQGKPISSGRVQMLPQETP